MITEKEVINSASKEEKVNQKGMPILFISPPLSLVSNFDKFVSKTPPLGIAYLASVLEENGFSNVKIIDMIAEEIDFNRLKEEILKFKPTVLGITLVTRQVNLGTKIIKITKKINPKIFCIIGGIHPSALPEKTLRETNADVCVFGEGELTILELVKALSEGREFNSIEGIVFKKENLIKKNPPRALVKDINSLPFPARHLLLTPEEYSKDSQPALTKNETVIITSRGCPFRCSFCDKSVFGKTYRVRSAKNVVDEIEFLVKKYNIESIRFYDDLLTAIPKRIKDICGELKEKNLKIKWSCESRVNTVNPGMLAMMKEAGCIEIHYGIESGNQRILELQQKDITLEQIRNAVKWTNEAGIDSRGYFIFGLPGDTRETALETIKFGKSLNLTSSGIFFYVPYPGTFEKKYRLEDYGKVLAKNWDDYIVFERPAYLPNRMTEEELIKLYKRAYLEMHLNIKSIYKLLKRTKNIITLKHYIQEFLWSIYK